MTKIKDMYNKFSEGDYPEYVPPGNFRTQSNPNDNIKDVREGFQSATMTGPGSSGSDTNDSSQGYRVEKCVRFDPEQEVGADGIIKLDTEGKPLKHIQNSRDANKKIWLGTMSSPGSVSLTSVEKGIVYSFVALCIIAIISVAFLYTTQNTGIYNRVLPGARSIGYFSVQGLALFIFGIGIGMSTIPATCPPSNCNDVKNEPLIVSAVLIGLLFIYAISNL
jgi:hypothetical protein